MTPTDTATPVASPAPTAAPPPRLALPVLTILLVGLLAASSWRAWRLDTPVAQLTPRGTGTWVNLNHADAAELSLLPGIGPRIARSIVSHRQAQGPFRTLADLDAVPWIGPTILQQIRPYVRFADDDRPDDPAPASP